MPRSDPRAPPIAVPDAVDDAFADAEPAARVTATTTPDGFVRIEVCRACAASVGLGLLPDEAVDALH